ncbi:MAG: glycosyltransferase family 2 protein [Firmicutes bacterium]|nr:glycosyltransferase family 2 protein [Bacillota bacterium]
MNQVIVIPSLNPCPQLPLLIDNLIEGGADKIVLVNDGSKAEYLHIFDNLAQNKGVKLLTHKKNKGKGKALKTAFKYVLKNFKNIDGVVTADSDGQHAPEDIFKVANELKEKPHSLIMGSRTLNTDTAPKESLSGNNDSARILNYWFGMTLPDTQTGLRGIPLKILPWVARLRGKRYEYELNVLIRCYQRKVEITVCPIQTIYLNDNSGSHFHRKKDTMRLKRMGVWCWFVRPLRKKP